MGEHGWLETLEKEQRGNVVLDAVFDPEFLIVHATRQHQRQKIDRFHIKKDDAMIIHRVDYKTEPYWPQRTGNFALEDISVERDDIVIDRGWVHTTIADLLITYVPAWDQAFVTQMSTIRQRWDEITSSGCEYKHATTTHDSKGRPIRPYRSWNYLPKVRWLNENGFFEKVVHTNKLQLKLFV